MTVPEMSDDALRVRGPSLPRMHSHQSNSLPSTPRQLARDGPFEATASSSGTQTRVHSPRSTSSESHRIMFNYNPPVQGCRFMSTQVSRRRMPYSDEAGGAAILAKPEQEPKRGLGREEEARLSKELENIYQRLLPSEDNQTRRQMLLAKLNGIIAQEWPGKDFEVHVFGSSGNLLYTDESDVDICVIMEELTTCALAELLNRRAMRNVKCVHAKIRIVKMQDPDLDLKCDLNVNNELALTNTQMVKTYIRLDPRVRPLAMIVKFWTRERIINEASGGTLSSYTWTLLLINFLQTRQPPILPRLPTLQGNGKLREVFSTHLETYSGFGLANTETLGELFFNFYRRYGYEINFETAVISVREACLLSKTEKNWHLATNNRLCVEEPFSTDRNLGNTADDSAWRGLHLEVRRAFDLIAEAKDIASEVCQHYDFFEQPKPQIERPQLAPRPAVLTRSLSQSSRSGRGGGNFRSGRQPPNRDAHRGTGPNVRRASSAATFGHNPNPVYAGAQLGIPPDLMASQHPPTQPVQQMNNGLHDRFVQMQQSLMAREQELRQHAATIAQASAKPGSAATNVIFGAPPRSAQLSNLQGHGPRAVEEPPPTAPLQPQYGYPYVRYDPNTGQLISIQSPPQQGGGTSGSSPLMTSTPLRRELSRNQLPSSPGASVRSHSQPARPPGPQVVTPSNTRPRHSMMISSPSQDLRSTYPVPQNMPQPAWIGPFMSPTGWFIAPHAMQSRPREYLGYGFTGPPQVANQYQPPNIIRATTYDDLRRQSRQMSSASRQSSLAASMPGPSRSPSPLRDANGHYETLRSAPLPTERLQPYVEPSSQNSTDHSPLIVNGSYVAKSQPTGEGRSSEEHPRSGSDSDGCAQSMVRSWSNVETSTTSETIYPSSEIYTDSQLYTEPETNEGDRTKIEPQQIQPDNVTTESTATAPTKDSPPNGNSIPWVSSPLTAKTTKSGVTNFQASPDLNWAPAEGPSTSHVSLDASSKGGPSTLRRQSGAAKLTIPPLDLGLSMPERLSSAKVLSPVQETRTPSPTSNRKRETRGEQYMNGINGSATLPLGNLTQQPPTPSKLSSGPDQTSAVTDASPVSAGPNRPSPSKAANPNPWQQASKKGGKRAKGSQGQSEIAEARSGGQPMPANVSERKGG